MALTNDDKRQIWGLYGQGYSYRKIWEKTDFRELTVRKYVNELSKQVFILREEGLEAEQIAGRLECSLAAVNRALKKYEEYQKGETKRGLETEKVVKENEPPKKLAVRTGWDEFQNKQELEQRKEKIRINAAGQLYFIKDSEEYHRNEGVIDVDYSRRQKAIVCELEDFILIKVDEIDSIEAICELEAIIKEIDKKIEVFMNDYDKKAGVVK